MLLEVKDLRTHFKTNKGIIKAVNGVTYSVEEGRTLGIVGESGSGKSITAMSILQLLESNGSINSGEINFEGKNLVNSTKQELYELRGNKISMIFQEPMTSLNPVLTIKDQINETFIIHQKLSKKQATTRTIDILNAVKIPNPEKVAKQYPHELSGGMRQRVMIAMALACEPKLLIADEPTTALDVTIQAQILILMNELKQQKGTSILFITHDLGVIRQMADDVAVMYCGQVVERGNVDTIFFEGEFSHPYTEGLLKSIPHLDTNSKQKLDTIDGTVPHPLELPTGCKFSTRCRYATEYCKVNQPTLQNVNHNHEIRCFYPDKNERTQSAPN